MSNELVKTTTIRRSRVDQSKALLIGFSQETVIEITKALEAVGWVTVPTEDSDHAARECVIEQFDFILIDVDGVDQFAPELVRSLRNGAQLNSGSTIIALSNYFMPSFKDRLKESGVDGFCSFPLQSGVLVASLTEASVSRARSANAMSTRQSF